VVEVRWCGWDLHATERSKGEAGGQRMSAPRALLVFCAWCPTWGRDAAFLGAHVGHGVSHGICPVCRELLESEFSAAMVGHGLLAVPPHSPPRAASPGAMTHAGINPRPSLRPLFAEACV
jgi:hypothetical protein